RSPHRQACSAAGRGAQGRGPAAAPGTATTTVHTWRTAPSPWRATPRPRCATAPAATPSPHQGCPPASPGRYRKAQRSRICACAARSLVPSLLTGSMNQGSSISFLRTLITAQGQRALHRQALQADGGKPATEHVAVASLSSLVPATVG